MFHLTITLKKKFVLLLISFKGSIEPNEHDQKFLKQNYNKFDKHQCL